MVRAREYPVPALSKLEASAYERPWDAVPLVQRPESVDVDGRADGGACPGLAMVKAERRLVTQLV